LRLPWTRHLQTRDACIPSDGGKGFLARRRDLQPKLDPAITATRRNPRLPRAFVPQDRWESFRYKSSERRLPDPRLGRETPLRGHASIDYARVQLQTPTRLSSRTSVSNPATARPPAAQRSTRPSLQIEAGLRGRNACDRKSQLRAQPSFGAIGL